MHYHLEIIMPETNNIENAIGQIMKPFCEGLSENDDEKSSYTFWDWYSIGGRFSGNKILADLDKKKLQKFHEELNKKKITVSGVQFGKQELSPSNQIPLVDELWIKFLPESKTKICPIFKHSGESKMDYDICALKDIPKNLTAERVIIANKNSEGDFEAIYMIEQSFWNGVCHIDTKWNGNVLNTLKLMEKHFRNYNPEYVKENTPKKDWIAVTVDYHS